MSEKKIYTESEVEEFITINYQCGKDLGFSNGIDFCKNILHELILQAFLQKNDELAKKYRNIIDEFDIKYKEFITKYGHS